MSAPITWADREQGRRLTFMCPCGRRVYVTRSGPEYKCDGCAELIQECYCPPVPRPEAVP